MALSNGAIADALEELGDLYELDGAIVHRVLAYRTAAKTVREASVSVGALAREGRATELRGIGATLQEKIQALEQTGTIPAAEKLRAQFPAGLIEITHLPGIGAKRARLLHDELQIDSAQALREAALAQRVRTVRGLGAKFEEHVLQALARADAEPAERRGRGGRGGRGGARGRLILPKALELADALVHGLSEAAAADGSKRSRGAGAARGSRGSTGSPAAGRQSELTVIVAGSARRLADSVKDIDLIAVTSRPLELAQSLAGLEQIETVSSASATGARGRTHSGVAVDLRIGAPEQAGNLLQHFTGSGPHNAALREQAVRAGLHISEHGVLDDSDGRTRMCATEREVYELIGLSYIEPELREDRGELQAAAIQANVAGASAAEASPAGRTRARGRAKGAATNAPVNGDLPQLIEQRDIRGDLHTHTVASDGHATIAEMAVAARELGYEYIAITDHSASHGFGNAVSPDQLRAQIERVHALDASIDGIRVLAGSEVNILPDGSLDYEDELLAALDWIVASVHTSFDMDERAMTERVVRAIEHPLVDAIGHPTGRLIERREPYAIDLDAVFAAAARAGTLLEINGNPDRRDLPDVHARNAARAGVTIVIDSDAHRIRTLANMRWGVATARRAWLRKEDVANTRAWEELSRMRKRSRQTSA